MQFTDGMHVYTENKQEVGRISHVVLDQTDKMITHVVVRQGLLFAEDKLIPFELFLTANPEEVILRADIESLEQLPSLWEPHYIPVERANAAVADAPIMAGGWYMESSADNMPRESDWREFEYVESEKLNIRDGTVALKAGARLISTDDQHVGNIESILTKADAAYASHVVIVRGLLAKTRRIMPTSWFHFIEMDTVYLSENTASVATLPEY